MTPDTHTVLAKLIPPWHELSVQRSVQRSALSAKRVAPNFSALNFFPFPRLWISMTTYICGTKLTIPIVADMEKSELFYYEQQIKRELQGTVRALRLPTLP